MTGPAPRPRRQREHSRTRTGCLRLRPCSSDSCSVPSPAPPVWTAASDLSPSMSSPRNRRCWTLPASSAMHLDRAWSGPTSSSREATNCTRLPFRAGRRSSASGSMPRRPSADRRAPRRGPRTGGGRTENLDGALEQEQSATPPSRYCRAISKQQAGNSDSHARVEGQALSPEHLRPGPERRHAVALPASPPRHRTWRRPAKRLLR